MEKEIVFGSDGGVLTCPVCGNSSLTVKRILVNQAVNGMLIDFDFSGTSATVAIDGGGGDSLVTLDLHCPCNDAPERVGLSTYLHINDKRSEDEAVPAVWDIDEWADPADIPPPPRAAKGG
jgi:hypothetical protein